MSYGRLGKEFITIKNSKANFFMPAWIKEELKKLKK